MLLKLAADQGPILSSLCLLSTGKANQSLAGTGPRALLFLIRAVDYRDNPIGNHR